MLIERRENPTWLSNAYLVADAPGGSGVLIDGNGVDADLADVARAQGIAITHLLVTHHHPDHVVDVRERAAALDVPLLASREAAAALGGADRVLADTDVVQSGGLRIEAIATPGHCPGHLAFRFGDRDVLTADVLFRGTVGGTMGGGETGFADLRHSVMLRLLVLPPDTRVHPGHREATTVGEEWEANPFVRVWRGLDEEGAHPCTVQGEPATLVLWAADYDGGHKAWVRFPDGREAIVGGSRVER